MAIKQFSESTTSNKLILLEKHWKIVFKDSIIEIFQVYSEKETKFSEKFTND